MEKLENLILEQIKEKKKDSEFLKYGVSQGYGIYYSTKNYPSIKERKSLEKVIKLADKRMYRSKEKFKKNYSESVQEKNQASTDTIAETFDEPNNPELIENSGQ